MTNDEVNKKYIPIIGLEIHAELNTRTKMFCGCVNNTDEVNPNHNICPVCMGHPGTLPVINKQAVKHVLKMGVAAQGNLADYTEFDRKNYFYPDIPKGYQISQFKYPLVSGGLISGVELTRVHLEEDTAKSSHDATKSVDANADKYSLVDFNRAGLPLMELVTEPVIHSAEQAVTFAKELQTLLRYLGAGEANMEKGEMRVEANISVSRADSKTPEGKLKFGTKVEVKNLNSFRAVERAIAYEIARHIDILEATEIGNTTEKIIQETRGWDETKQKTFSQRVKEDSNDYRYFPDPDLPKLKLSEIPEFSRDSLYAELPELPWQKRDRYKKDFGMKDEDAEMFVQQSLMREFFESVVSKIGTENVETIKLAINYITSDLAGLIKKTDSILEKIPVSPEAFAELIMMIKNSEVSSRGAKDTLAIIFTDGLAGNISTSAKSVAMSNGLIQKNDPEELKRILSEIIAANQSVVEDYKNGKQTALQFFVGQAMKATKGSANPELIRNTILEIIG